MDLYATTAALVSDLEELSFSPPVTLVYNPLDYARRPYGEYLDRFGRAPKDIVFLGMNPGPWGMAQTGVPFGEVSMVRDWMGIEAPVGRPVPEHPKRPVTGFDCPRREVSGARVWGWAKEAFGTAGRFFDRRFVANYCPLMFMDEAGKNITPDKLRVADRRAVEAVCDVALQRTIEHLGARWVIGFGRFAHDSAARALAGTGVRTGRVLHPSPANPAANRGWAGQMTSALEEAGIDLS